MLKIPKVHKHDLSLSVDGVGSRNNKEYCNCKKCIMLRQRRDNIFNKLEHRIKRWCNMNF